MECVITRSKRSRQKDDASKSKGHKSGSKDSVTSNSKRSESFSVLKARAAAREAKSQVEMEALKQKELLEREELILRQRREEQQRALEKFREEEIRKLQIQSQREEWEIMNPKRILQKELDMCCD